MAVTPALDARELYRFFHTGDDEVFALRGVSVRVAPGEVVAVLGPSGSGKSTLLGCCAGLDDPDGGSVRVAGDLLSRRPASERAALRARRVGVLYQSGNLFGHLTLAGNLRVVQRLARQDDRARRVALLEQLALGDRAGAVPSQLSGGELVRAGLALALVNRPALLVADEPTGEVDSVTESGILALILGEVDAGVGALVATHSRAVAAIADRTVELVDGAAA